MSYRMDKHVTSEKTLKRLKDLIEDQADEKMNASGIDTDEIKKRVLAV